MQHMIADGGNTQPPLFRAGMLSSLFLPQQFNFDDPVPEVSAARPLIRFWYLWEVWRVLIQFCASRKSSQKLCSRLGACFVFSQ